MNRMSFNQKVPSHVAFLVVIVLSFLLSWFTIAEGKKITENAKNSEAFDIAKRLQK
ncbi:MAG TPA: hypothetical protein P5232_03995 [Candidatus Moranbacteria bacterium]|nr:hypothetical protein [Candidatus Moranbacteria bacterium]